MRRALSSDGPPTEMTERALLESIAFYALLLNGIWEYAQLRPLYTCWEAWSGAQKLLCPPMAILGDVLIVGGLAALTALMTGEARLVPQNVAGWSVLLVLSFAASLFFEWAARRLRLWDYQPAMPTLRLGTERVGLAPVMQITLLPAASLLLARLFPL